MFKLEKIRNTFTTGITDIQAVDEYQRGSLHVNFVVSKDLKSKIFYDIFRRFANYDDKALKIEVSEKPLPGADIYHYHRPHLETELATPAVVTVHHDPGDIDPWLEPEKFWATYRQTARIVCLNTLQVAQLKANGLSQTTVIPHGFDTKVFSKKIKKFNYEKKLNFGIISKKYARRVKGDAYVEEALKRLDPDRIRFTLVGSGRSADAALFRQFGFEVEVYELLPYRMFGKLYREMDFLFMVSTNEGGPANIPEALASSVPALCTRCGMVPDLIKDGENGIILSGDIRKDAPVLEQITTNQDGITDRLFNGAHELNTIISWEEVVRRHIQMYWEILETSPAHAQSAS